MREILFRGKRFSNSEWVIGGIIKTFHPNYDCENEADFLSQKPNCYCICANNKDYFVEQASIGQYTGLTDKNGKKIFEGDICQHRSYYSDNIVISVVTYTGGQFLALVDENSGFNLSDKLEVIGNIHDNPELLKGGAE